MKIIEQELSESKHPLPVIESTEEDMARIFGGVLNIIIGELDEDYKKYTEFIKTPEGESDKRFYDGMRVQIINYKNDLTQARDLLDQ